jgi:hypothetical protein
MDLQQQFSTEAMTSNSVGRTWRAPARSFPLALPLSTLTARLQHGAVGVWDEVAVGAVLIGCALAYAVWFYFSGRKDDPQDSE